MRYCYVLSADEPNSYWRMTRVSAMSVRIWDNAAEIFLLTDKVTKRALDGAGLFERDLRPFDQLIEVDTPNGNAALRSRYLKTGMRQLVRGDFLFLDSDTIVCGELSGHLWQHDFEAVADQHRKEAMLPDIERDVFSRCGWRPVSRFNFNSGVMFWRDSPGSRKLGKVYRKKWQESVQATGRHNDQQALNSAIEDLNGEIDVGELPAAFNAQIGLRPELAFDAKVWHIFSSDRDRVPMMAHVFEAFWHGEKTDDLEPLVRRRHPFLVGDLSDRMVVALLRRRGDEAGNLPFNDWRRLWLAGEHGLALKRLARETRNRVSKSLRRILSIPSEFGT